VKLFIKKKKKKKGKTVDWMIAGSPCLPPMAMNSPLFYELDACYGPSSDACDKNVTHSVTVAASSRATPSRPSSLLRLNLNGGSGGGGGSGGAGAGAGVRVAPIRVSNAVFGNARNATQLELESPSYVELADINTPEISLDLQGLIECEGLLSDLSRGASAGLGPSGLTNNSNNSNNSSNYNFGYLRNGSSAQAQYMPHQYHHHQQQQQHHHHQQQQQFAQVVQQQQQHQVKEEPQDSGGAYSPPPPATAAAAAAYAYGAYGDYGGAQHYHASTSVAPGGKPSPSSVKSVSSSASSGCSKRSKRADKGTDEYRRRRERNNIAVRKSREKAKLRSRETEEKLKLLVRDNERLQKRVEQLTEELNILHTLFSNVSVVPENIQREVAKHLENIQHRYQ